MEKIIEKTVVSLSPSKHYIWTEGHVKSYMTGETAFIWILRVYKLKEPYWAEPTPCAIKWANLKNEVSLDGIEPVLRDSEFDELLNNINI